MMEEYKEGQFRMDFENTGRANRKRRIFLDTETTGMCTFSNVGSRLRVNSAFSIPASKAML